MRERCLEDFCVKKDFEREESSENAYLSSQSSDPTARWPNYNAVSHINLSKPSKKFQFRHSQYF